jgi:hypothetical protein
LKKELADIRKKSPVTKELRTPEFLKQEKQRIQQKSNDVISKKIIARMMENHTTVDIYTFVFDSPGEVSLLQCSRGFGDVSVSFLVNFK